MYVCVRVSQGNNVIIAMYVICICMSHVCIFVLYFALQIWRIIKYLITFSTAIQKECLPNAPINIYCGNFAITRHECICKSNQR